MKKIICLAILSVALTNCQKNKYAITPSASQESSSELVNDNKRTAPNPGNTNSLYRKFQMVQGSCSCFGIGGNCLPDVIVTPSNARRTSTLKDLSTTIGTGNKNQISDFFAKNEIELAQFIPLNTISAVINKTNTVTKMSNDGKSDFLLFTEKKVIVLVLPIVFK